MDTVAQLKVLLNANRLPSGVTSLEELLPWLENLSPCLQEWAQQHEAQLFSPEDTPMPQAPASPVEDASPPVSPPCPLNTLAAPAGEPMSPPRSPKALDGGIVAGEIYSLDEPLLMQEWENVRKDNHPINWVLLGLQAKGPKAAKPQVELVGRGEGGLRELIPYLDDTRVLFGGFRVTAIDDKTGVVSYRSKFVAIVWVGEKLGAMAKAKVTMQRADFAKIFHGAHLNLQISDASEISPEYIEAQLQANAGAHKPSRYEF